MRIKEVQSELEFLDVFETLAHALQEVSMLKMQSVRKNVDQARIFHEGLAQAYRDVRLSAKYDPLKAKGAIVSNKKSISVLLSANSTMYGTLSDEVFELFKKHAADNADEDLIILGKMGRDKYEKEKDRREYKYFDLNDVSKMYSNMLKIVSELIYYEMINIFYGQFVNLFTQKPVKISIPGNLLQDLLGKEVEQVTLDMIFSMEPSTEELERFFAAQVMGMLFKQSVTEFELARHAARVSSLEKSLDNTIEQKKKTILLINKIKREKGGSGVARTIAVFRRRK